MDSKRFKLITGTLEVLPNGYVVHSPDQGATSIYRSLSSLKTPLTQYTASYVEVLPFSGVSFLIYQNSKKDPKVIGFGADGKKKWVRALNINDQVTITGNNFLVENDNMYWLYSKDNQLLGKQQIGERGDTEWIYRVTPSGEITVEKQLQWQERPPVINENDFEGDWAREDFYVLDPVNLQINYHLSTLWNDINAGQHYIYAGKGELYLTDYWFENTVTKYILK